MSCVYQAEKNWDFSCCSCLCNRNQIHCPQRIFCRGYLQGHLNALYDCALCSVKVLFRVLIFKSCQSPVSCVDLRWKPCVCLEFQEVSIFAEVLFLSQSLMSSVDTRSWRVLSLLQMLKVNCFSKGKCDEESFWCPVMILYNFHRMISCLHVDFKCFKLVLWPAFRQKFMTIKFFWSFFTRPGDNHDKKISN